MAGRSANIRDVAKLAGVSHMTVSRVLNGHPNISDAARARVELSMAQLKYRPSGIARTLATSRSGTIGVVCTDSGHFGPPKTLRAIEAAARDTGYFVSTTNLASVGRDSMRSALTHLTDQGVDALVIIAPEAAMLDALGEFELRVPYVTVEPTGRRPGHTLAIDQYAGARIATQHLLGLGHTSIAHVSGPSDWLDSQARVRGWRDVLAAAGLPVPDPFVGDWSLESGHALADVVASSGASAVFVSNDHMALGLVRGLLDLRVGVPGDVSVIGFDGVPEAAYFSPALSTVLPDYDLLGRRCIEMLVDGLQGNDLPREEVLIEPALVVRDSTAAHPSRS